MSRPLFNQQNTTPKVQNFISNFHKDIIEEVQKTVDTEEIVVVGMKWNPFVRRVRKELETRNIPFKYLEYGSYVSQWDRRLALKMYTGWPTFPQVFVKGKLIGGNQDTKTALEDGTFDKLWKDQQ
eukprot:TRINITY_DN13728_c0_g1_i1.p1 TRINITY_DN13728_c0_g1~~TRINITY_DN13728_c0_g1_i1.p1  ORF type:complete len:144 (-),score=24.10 TRINITY_DN13728_c0_g1_i1:93-467(-)